MELIPAGPTNKGPADRFTGDVYATVISAPDVPPYLAAGIVRFAPGSRTNWHVHPGGQTLHVTDGVAVVATRDGQVVLARSGETIRCTPGEEHWHGATEEALMAHLAMVVGDATSDGTTWLEPVTDAQYEAAVRR